MRLSQWMSLMRGLTEAFVLKFYALVGPRVFSRRYFEYRYRHRTDPWRYETSPYEQRKYQLTLQMISHTKYQRALEVGCSIGVFTEQLAERKIADLIVGMDVAQNALERAQERVKRFENVELHLADITRDPLEGSFDLIVCAEILYYLGRKNLEIARDKLLHALTGGGHLVLVNPWPLSQQLHRQFFQRPELRLLQEHIERDSERPYAITLYDKIS